MPVFPNQTSFERKSPTCLGKRIVLRLLLAGLTYFGTFGAAGTAMAGDVNFADSSAAVRGLRDHLKTLGDEPAVIRDQEFANVPLTRQDSDAARELLVKHHTTVIRKTREGEVRNKVIKLDDLELKFAYTIFGNAPPNGRSLFLSMHGGGNAAPGVNDQQWENQKTLYQPKEGVYLAPRAPTNTWDLWHQSHIDRFFTRLIEDMIVFEKVDPNRVYLMGYSAGGDGVYQLAPRMADQFAAAAMMAGHPNETEPDGLRNLPFILQVGGKDTGFKRNEIARQFGEKLDALARKDKGAYPHLMKIYPKHGHWMNLEDKIALPWMQTFTRTLSPDKVVWRQDDVLHDRFYWLRVNLDEARGGQQMIVSRKGLAFTVETQPESITTMTLLLNDVMGSLDERVTVKRRDGSTWKGTPHRTIAALSRTLNERGDPAATFAAELPFPCK